MNGYFRPLRRKVGVITLAMACVLACGWVQSISRPDVIAVRIQADSHLLVSSVMEVLSIATVQENDVGEGQPLFSRFSIVADNDADHSFVGEDDSNMVLYEIHHHGFGAR